MNTTHSKKTNLLHFSVAYLAGLDWTMASCQHEQVCSWLQCDVTFSHIKHRTFTLRSPWHLLVLQRICVASHQENLTIFKWFSFTLCDTKNTAKLQRSPQPCQNTGESHPSIEIHAVQMLTHYRASFPASASTALSAEVLITLGGSRQSAIPESGVVQGVV